MTDLERELLSTFGWLLYPIPLPPLVLSVIAAWTTTRGARRLRRQGAPAGVARSSFAVLVLGIDALVVLFAGAFSGAWALWTLMWLAGPALVTVVALFQIRRLSGAAQSSAFYWDSP
jgi:hypothetical protein